MVSDSRLHSSERRGQFEESSERRGVRKEKVREMVRVKVWSTIGVG